MSNLPLIQRLRISYLKAALGWWLTHAVNKWNMKKRIREANEYIEELRGENYSLAEMNCKLSQALYQMQGKLLSGGVSNVQPAVRRAGLNFIVSLPPDAKVCTLHDTMFVLEPNEPARVLTPTGLKVFDVKYAESA